MARLVIEKGKDKGKQLELRENGTFLVGRDLRTHLRLRDLQASRRHLKVTLKGTKATLEDLDSSNGTVVNGERVRSVELKRGDKVQVGETLIFYLEDDAHEASPAPPPVAGPPSSGLVVQANVETRPLERVRKGDLTGRELAGYRIGRLLGRGGMGTVYEALQISL